MSTKTIEIKCKGAEKLDIAVLKDFQQDLKNLSKNNKAKLKKSLLEHGFIAPFFVWKNNNSNFLLDGHQRLKVLLEIKKEGIGVPELPVVYIEAKNKEDAKKKLLQITSQYGEFTFDGLESFIEGVELDLQDFSIEMPKEQTEEIAGEVEFSEELLEEYNYVVLFFDNPIDWLQAQTFFNLESKYSKRANGKPWSKGIGRIVNGQKYIERMRG